MIIGIWIPHGLCIGRSVSMVLVGAAIEGVRTFYNLPLSSARRGGAVISFLRTRQKIAVSFFKFK